MGRITKRATLRFAVALSLLVLQACGSDPLLVAEGDTAHHTWRYELIDALPQWVVDGKVLSRTITNPQFAPASPHLTVNGGWFHIQNPFVQVDVQASEAVEAVLLVLDGRVVGELPLTTAKGSGEVRQHAAAALADRDSWSAVVACQEDRKIGLDYGWLPDGFPDWDPPEEICRDRA